MESAGVSRVEHRQSSHEQEHGELSDSGLFQHRKSQKCCRIFAVFDDSSLGKPSNETLLVSFFFIVSKPVKRNT